MTNNIDNGEFKYLSDIVAALEKFYQRDYQLIELNRLTHEQTISFRMAMYLSQRLELSNGFYVDCEYHGDKNRPELRKMIGDALSSSRYNIPR